MPTIKTYEPSERAQQILSLAKEALTGAEEVRTRIRNSTETALECGRLLLKEKAHALKKLGHGAWTSYFEITFAKTIPDRTARHWMRMAGPKTAIADRASHSESNELRNAVLTLGLFPPKQHTAPSAPPNGDAPASYTPRGEATLPRHSTHLALVNRFSAWRAWLKGEAGETLDVEQAAQLLKDFEPIEQFIESLRSTLEQARRTVSQ